MIYVEKKAKFMQGKDIKKEKTKDNVLTVAIKEIQNGLLALNAGKS